MKKVTLGGERIGSGNKMQVELHGYERSTHNKSKVVRTSMSPGTIVPIYTEIALPGDTWDIGFRLDMQTQQTLGALFGSYKIQIETYTCPVRLYQADLHNNKLKIGMNMSAVKLPLIEIPARDLDISDLSTNPVDNQQINSSCILAYLGIRGVGNNRGAVNPIRYFNAIPWLGYWDIVKNYHTNKQEEIGAYIHNDTNVPGNVTKIDADYQGTTTTLAALPGGTPGAVTIGFGGTLEITYTGGTAPAGNDIMIIAENDVAYTFEQLTYATNDTGTVLTGTWNPDYGTFVIKGWRYRSAADGATTYPQVVTFPLSNLDDIRNEILWEAGSTTPYILDVTKDHPFGYVLGVSDNIPNCLSTQEGLAVKCYLSDLFNNWLNTEWIDGVGGITEVTAIDVSGGTLEIDQLNIAQKIWKMLNRVAMSDGTYYSWIETVYDTEVYARTETPIYHGGMIQELVFQEVVSTAATEGKPLGELAGRGVLGRDRRGGYVSLKCSEHSVVMILMSITPRIDYSQGNKWFTHLLTMDDFHKPQLDEIGFQELITEQMHWAETDYDNLTSTWVQKSAGKQPAWLNYMTDTNDTYGSFAEQNDQMYMTLNRRYELETYSTNRLRISDLTTYIDPVKYNHIFADTRLDAMNFMAQIGLDIEVRRKMSGKIMPNL